MSRYKWDHIDERYNWVAKDSNGRVDAYTERPFHNERLWYPTFGSQHKQLGYSPPWESDDDWKESLEERPKPAKRYELMEFGEVLDTATGYWLKLVEIVDLLNEYEKRKS